MGSPPTLDLESLLAPIADGAPAGEDMRAAQDGLNDYHRAKDARKQARDAEASALFDPAARAVAAQAWRDLSDLCQSVLRQRSKDLQVAAWAIEALVRLEGFAGLRDGFLLARGLVERYWEELYPRHDEAEGWLDRTAPLAGLNGVEGGDGALIAPIGMARVIESADHGSIALWHIEQARELERSSDPATVERRVEQGALRPEDLRQALDQASPQVLGTALADLEEALAAQRELDAALDQRLGPDAPPSSAIRRALEGALETLRFTLRDRVATGASPGTEAGPEPGAPAQGEAPTAAGAPRPAGAVDSRAAAFQAIQAAAQWFRHTEPHSPLAFLLEQAVRWGHLPLPQLLEELIPDDSARSFYHQLTGIPLASSEE